MTYKKIDSITEISAVVLFFIGIIFISMILIKAKILSIIFGVLFVINILFIIFLFGLSEFKYRKFVKEFWG